MKQSAKPTFYELFGQDSSGQFEAPGRVNLIGEHTDYNGGFVLPTAIPQKTRVEIRPRQDKRVRVASINQGAGISEFTIGEESRLGSWIDYVQGVTSVLGRNRFPVPGFDARIESNVPVGSGLSSSAALEVALLRAIRKVFNLDYDDVAIARFGQKVENEFVGARVGIMDQMAASLAGEGEALFLDTRDLSYKRIRIPAEKVELIVINSGVSHSNVSGDYNQRRSECEEACSLLGVSQLRDIGVRDLARLDPLPDTLKRRARHVVTENQRVLDAVAAIEGGDMRRLGRLFGESHSSMRDDYQVSIPEIDQLVHIAQSQPEVFGARLTGGGFGGSIVALCQVGSGRETSLRIAAQYDSAVNRQAKAQVLVPDVSV